MHAALGPRYQMLKSNAANLWEGGHSLLFHPPKASTKLDCGSGAISRKMRINNTMLLLISLIGALSYLLDSQYYTEEPTVSHRAIQVEETLELVDETSERVDETLRRVDTRPNVIYIQHESLSGSILLNTKKGKTSAPFFHDRMANDPDFYVFEHHRTGSGNTIDAMPSLMTGCLPYTVKGMEYAHAKGRSIGYEFAENGYSTASFSSRTLDEDLIKGRYRMLYDMLAGSMDKVEDATRNKRLKLDNSQGSSDGQMLPLFEEWLAELAQQEGEEKNPTGEGAAKKPFYAQFYNFNQHYPYLDLSSKKMKRSDNFGDKYYGSLRATDEFLKSLFDILSRTGQLENTIIVGSGDHGEEPFKYRYARLDTLNSHILHAAAYVYYPRNLMMHEGVAERLRRNTQQLSYTLDMYPTIRSILYGVSGVVNGDFDDPSPLSDPDTAAAIGCLTGVDLTSVDVPKDRAVLATNLASSKLTIKKKNLKLYALITKDSALYLRRAVSNFPGLRQRKRYTYVLEFGSCTQSTTSFCMTNLSSEHQREYFRRAVVWLRKKGNVFFGEDIQRSKLVKTFVGMIGGEKAMKKTEKAMKKEQKYYPPQDLTKSLLDLSREGSLLGHAGDLTVEENTLEENKVTTKKKKKKKVAKKKKKKKVTKKKKAIA